MDEYIEREAIGKAYMDLCLAKSKLAKSRKGVAFFEGDLLPEAEPTVKELFGLINAAPAADVAPVVWKPVLGFDGLYEVSSLGQIRNKNGEIMKQGIKRTPCTCYKVVRLWKEGAYYTKYVHRLIAEAFIPNPDKLPMINHKDEDGTNNLICNLEWCTREYNVNYGTAKERRAKKIRGRASEKRVPVNQYTVDGKFVAQYLSVALAAKEVGGTTGMISAACNGKRKTAYGYTWKHAERCGAKMTED